MFRKNGTVENLRSKAAIDLAKGDVVEMFVGGSAGFARASERPDAMIDSDLADGSSPAIRGQCASSQRSKLRPKQGNSKQS